MFGYFLTQRVVLFRNICHTSSERFELFFKVFKIFFELSQGRDELIQIGVTGIIHIVSFHRSITSIDKMGNGLKTAGGSYFHD